MKTNYLSLKLALFLVLPFALLQMFTSCSKNIEFENSNVVPAARGDISVKKDKNNNYNIKLEISYLAEPERLQPPKKILCGLVVIRTKSNSVKYWSNCRNFKTSCKV